MYAVKIIWLDEGGQVGLRTCLSRRSLWMGSHQYSPRCPAFMSWWQVSCRLPGKAVKLRIGKVFRYVYQNRSARTYVTARDRAGFLTN
jgi:hypothetical protein